MTKFNTLVVKALDGEEIHFITRGKSKPPTMNEVVEYCKDNNIWLKSDVKTTLEEDWSPLCGNKVFLADLRQGLSHCSGKYGVSEETIQGYIKKKMPHTNPNIYRGRDG